MAEETATETAQLQITGVLGNDPARVLLLAQPNADVEVDWLGDSAPQTAEEPAPSTLLLELREGVRRVGRVPHLLGKSWQSAHGKAYIAAESGQVVVYDGERFSAERVADEDTDITKVYGRSLERGQDVVVALASTRAFVRQGTGWQELVLPEDTSMVWCAAVRSADEIYFVGDTGILLYDGVELTALEIPETEFHGLVVRDDGDMLATSDEGLYQWSESAQRWDLHESDIPLTIALIDRGSEVLLATSEGVLSWDGTSFHTVADGIDSNAMYAVGSATFALGAQAGLAANVRGSWQSIAVPESLLEDQDHG